MGPVAQSFGWGRIDKHPCAGGGPLPSRWGRALGGHLLVQLEPALRLQAGPGCGLGGGCPGAGPMPKRPPLPLRRGRGSQGRVSEVGPCRFRGLRAPLLCPGHLEQPGSALCLCGRVLPAPGRLGLSGSWVRGLSSGMLGIESRKAGRVVTGNGVQVLALSSAEEALSASVASSAPNQRGWGLGDCGEGSWQPRPRLGACFCHPALGRLALH